VTRFPVFPIFLVETSQRSIFLFYNNSNLKTVSFPILKKASMIIFNFNSAVTSFSAPSLSTITDLILDGTSIQTLELPSLQTVTGETLQFGPGRFLQQIRCPMLQIAPTIIAYRNPQLKTLEFPKLTTIRSEITISGNANLTKIDFSAFKDGNPRIIIRENQLLNEILLSPLQSALSVDLVSNPALKKVTMNSISTIQRQLKFGFNPELTTLDFPSLKKVGLLEIDGKQLQFASFSKLCAVTSLPSTLSGSTIFYICSTVRWTERPTLGPQAKLQDPPTGCKYSC